MNPLYQSLMGRMGQGATPMANGPMNMANGLMGRVQQLAGMLQNPQQMVAKYFPDAPADVAGNPDALLQWMQQTGKVNPQMVQMARQMMGR